MGLPRTSNIGLGISWVSSRIRVPLPAANITALIESLMLISFWKMDIKKPVMIQ
jgi:hypothetical protein